MTLATFPGMWERALTRYTFTKAYAMFGWRFGGIVGPKQLLEPLRKVHEHTALLLIAPEFEPLNFSSSCLGQLIYEIDPTRVLVPGQPILAVF